MNNFELEINEYTVTVEVTYYHHQPPLGPTADNDVDALGYTDIEWDVVCVESYIFDDDDTKIKLTVCEVLDVIDEYSDTIECKLLEIMKGLREEREEDTIDG